MTSCQLTTNNYGIRRICPFLFRLSSQREFNQPITAPQFSQCLIIAPLYAGELASAFPYLGFANDGEVPRHKSLCQTG